MSDDLTVPLFTAPDGVQYARIAGVWRWTMEGYPFETYGRDVADDDQAALLDHIAALTAERDAYRSKLRGYIRSATGDRRVDAVMAVIDRRIAAASSATAP